MAAEELKVDRTLSRSIKMSSGNTSLSFMKWPIIRLGKSLTLLLASAEKQVNAHIRF